MNHEYQSLERKEMRKYVPATARRLLDVGCNTGTFGAGLKTSRSIEIWGVEPDVTASAKATRVLDHVLTCHFDQHAEIPENYFDVVTFNDVLEHFADPWTALRLARTKLHTDGIVIVSVPNILNKKNLEHMLVERDFRYENDGIRDRTHLRFFTSKSIQRTMEESGFSILTVEGINQDWYSSSLTVRLAYRLFARQLRETKYRQIAVVAKPLPASKETN